MRLNLAVGNERAERRRRRVRVVQRYILNPPMELLVWFGLVPGHVLVETTGRRSGRRRRNVVGMHVEGTTGWVVAEQGRHAGYVCNLVANPEVRVRIDRQWAAREPASWTATIPRPGSTRSAFGATAAAVRRFGTDLTTLRFDFRASNQAVHGNVTP